MDNLYLQQDKLYFSRDIPFFRWTDQNQTYSLQTVICFIFNRTRCIFSTDIFVDLRDHSVTFDIADIIYSYMMNQNISFDDFSVEIVDPERRAQITKIDFKVLFSKDFISVEPQRFTQHHFLNAFETLFVPEHFVSNIHIFENISPVDISFYLWTDRSDQRTLIRSLQLQPGLHTVEVDIDSLISDAVQHGIISDKQRPVRLTVQAAERRMTYFIRTDRRPAFALAFRNTFNCTEYFWSYGSWKRKQSDSADTTRIAGQIRTYSIDTERTFELTTHSLNPDSLTLWSAFMNSDTADISIFSGRKSILFQGTIVGSEISFDPDSGDMPAFKLSVEHTKDITSDRSARIFTNPFDISFT